MKPSDQKTINACTAMKHFGIAAAKTKAALKRLLKLYENNWELIEDENYRVLFNVLMPDEEGMTFTGQDEKHASSLSKYSLDSSRRAYQNTCGPSQPARKARVKCQEAFIREPKKELESKTKEAPPDNDTAVIELPAKRLFTRQQKQQALSLSRSCMEVTSSRRAQHSDDDLSSDSEESQPLLKRTCLRGQEEEVMICDSKGVIYGKTEGVEPLLYTYTRRKNQASSLPKSCAQTSLSPLAHQNEIFSVSDSEESEETPLISRRNRGRHQKKGVLVSKNNLVSCIPSPSKSPIVICLDSSSDSDIGIGDEEILGAPEVEPLTVDNIARVSDLSQMDDYADILEILNIEPLNVDSSCRVLASSQADVVSSLSKGEVHISLTCNSFPQSDVHFPNMEVEEERGIESDCDKECSLAIGTHSITNENARFREVPQKSKSQDVLAIKDDYQGGTCSVLEFPTEVFVFQNLIKIEPHIPRHIDHCRFGCLHSLIGFPIKDTENVFGKSGKRLRVLQGLPSSKVRKVNAAQNQHYSQVVKFCVYVDDITRGEEKMKIPMEGRRSAEDLSTFFYIPWNVVYKNADVNFSLRCTSHQACCPHCYGNCLALPVPCACSIQTGAGFAYTPDGLVKETFLEECLSVNHEHKRHHYLYCKKCPLESFRKKKDSNPCKGHLQQKFIKECWSKCGCNKNCGNRIIQQGISVKLQVFLTPEGKGWGLRTLEDLPKGAFVCEYVGEIVTSTEVYERNMKSAGKKHTYTVLLDANWPSSSKGVLKDEEALCLDATVYGNVARFINHRCSDASLVQIPVEVETPDHHYYHLALFTTRNVAAMEELTWDYGIDFHDYDHPVKPFHCLCRSKFCRGSDFILVD